MTRIALFPLASFALCLGLSVAQAANPAPVMLPDAVRNQLNAEYPGWKFSPVSAEVQKAFIKAVTGHPPSLVAVDFDHDGEKDYVVQILLNEPGKEEQIILAFIKGLEQYEETVLESRGPNPDVYLWLRRKAIPNEGGAGSTMKDILQVMGTETGDTNYLYVNGKFEEFHDEPAR